MYQAYRYRRLRPQRSRGFVVVALVLLTAAITSSVALVLSGCERKRKMQPENLVVTPAVDVWLLQVTGYATKMAAYQAAFATECEDCGVHVVPTDNTWTWVCAVYQDEKAAETARGKVPSATCVQYQIQSKQFVVPENIVITCREVLATLQSILEELLTLRTQIQIGNTTETSIRALTALQNSLKASVTQLQDANQTLQEDFVAALIYAANQNILALMALVTVKPPSPISLKAVNSALIKNIFSLDNF